MAKFKSLRRGRIVGRQLVDRKQLTDIADTQLTKLLDISGNTAVNYTKSTHTYNNRTGRLEASHFYRVLGFGEEGYEDFYERGGRIERIFIDSPNGWKLYIGARWFYGFILETRGYWVVWQGFQLLPSVIKEVSRKLKSSIKV